MVSVWNSKNTMLIKMQKETSQTAVLKNGNRTLCNRTHHKISWHLNGVNWNTKKKLHKLSFWKMVIGHFAN